MSEEMLNDLMELIQAKMEAMQTTNLNDHKYYISLLVEFKANWCKK